MDKGSREDNAGAETLQHHEDRCWDPQSAMPHAAKDGDADCKGTHSKQNENLRGLNY